MMAVTLSPLGTGDFARVAHIHVAPAQVKFSGTVAQAFEANEPGVDFHAIWTEGRTTGFFKIDRAYAKSHHFARPGELGLRAFLIDRQAQGQGIATAAVRTLDTYLPRHYPDARSVVLTVNMSNPAAKACYRKGGFTDTGEIYEGGMAGPQLVMRMPLVG